MSTVHVLNNNKENKHKSKLLQSNRSLISPYAQTLTPRLNAAATFKNKPQWNDNTVTIQINRPSTCQPKLNRTQSVCSTASTCSNSTNQSYNKCNSNNDDIESIKSFWCVDTNVSHHTSTKSLGSLPSYVPASDAELRRRAAVTAKLNRIRSIKLDKLTQLQHEQQLRQQHENELKQKQQIERRAALRYSQQKYKQQKHNELQLQLIHDAEQLKLQHEQSIKLYKLQEDIINIRMNDTMKRNHAELKLQQQPVYCVTNCHRALCKHTHMIDTEYKSCNTARTNRSNTGTHHKHTVSEQLLQQQVDDASDHALVDNPLYKHTSLNNHNKHKIGALSNHQSDMCTVQQHANESIISPWQSTASFTTHNSSSPAPSSNIVPIVLHTTAELNDISNNNRIVSTPAHTNIQPNQSTTEILLNSETELDEISAYSDDDDFVDDLFEIHDA